MTKQTKYIEIREGFIVVNKEGAIYTGSTRNGKNGFSYSPKVFKVYSTEGGAKASSPYQEAKYKHRENELIIQKINWEVLNLK